ARDPRQGDAASEGVRHLTVGSQRGGIRASNSPITKLGSIRQLAAPPIAMQIPSTVAADGCGEPLTHPRSASQPAISSGPVMPVQWVLPGSSTIAVVRFVAGTLSA